METLLPPRPRRRPRSHRARCVRRSRSRLHAQDVPAEGGTLAAPHGGADISTFSCPGIMPNPSGELAAKINQDRGVVRYPLAGRHDIALLAVFDGHGTGQRARGAARTALFWRCLPLTHRFLPRLPRAPHRAAGPLGHVISEYVATLLPTVVARGVRDVLRTATAVPPPPGGDRRGAGAKKGKRKASSKQAPKVDSLDVSVYLPAVLRSAFAEVNRHTLTDPCVRPAARVSGCTACVALVTPTKVITANIGDSRCVKGVLDTDGDADGEPHGSDTDVDMAPGARGFGLYVKEVRQRSPRPAGRRRNLLSALFGRKSTAHLAGTPELKSAHGAARGSAEPTLASHHRGKGKYAFRAGERAPVAIPARAEDSTDEEDEESDGVVKSSSPSPPSADVRTGAGARAPLPEPNGPLAHASPHGDVAWAAEALSNDHKPDAPRELARIQELGGFVTPAQEAGAPARLWHSPDWGKGFTISRSFGDFAVADCGMSAEPDITISVRARWQRWG